MPKKTTSTRKQPKKKVIAKKKASKLLSSPKSSFMHSKRVAGSAFTQQASHKSMPLAATQKLSSKKHYALPPGHDLSPEGVIYRTEFSREPVPSSKLMKGMENARASIKKLLKESASLMNTSYGIKEIELAVSFDAEGKFLGFGVGGSVTMKITIAPHE